MLVDCGNIQVKVGLLYLAQKRVTRKKKHPSSPLLTAEYIG